MYTLSSKTRCRSWAMRLRERHRVSRPTSDAAAAASDADVASETTAASSYPKRNLLESHHDCKRCPVLHVESALTFLMSFNLAGSRRGATSFEAGLRTKFESQRPWRTAALMLMQVCLVSPQGASELYPSAMAGKATS